MAIRTLILDDDESIRATLVKFLEDQGFEVYSYSEPENCPTFLKNICPCGQNFHCAEVIITDINMPGISGIKFIENQIRNGCKIKNIAVMSGEWTKEDRQKVRNIGCQIFEKPFSMLELKEWLDTIKATFQLDYDGMKSVYRAAQKSV